MSSGAEQIIKDLNQFIDPNKAAFLAKFFKTAKGEYGEGDRFIGVTVPNQRIVAKRHFNSVALEEVQSLLCEPTHEYRQTALFMLVYKFEKAKTEQVKRAIAYFYLENYSYVNNWDLVDSSAEKILGAYLFDKDKGVLYEYAKSQHLWKQRIAIISTFYFIRNKQYKDTLEIANILLHHKHDLIHKAVGWMLREIGNRDFAVEYDFLKEHYKEMPRTMLRYAIEKFEPELKLKFLRGII